MRPGLRERALEQREAATGLTTIIEQMPPLPDVAVQVLRIVNDPDYSLDDLVAIVRTDPALTARILKTCNSSLYSLNRRVSSVSEAVSFLGTRNLVKLVVSTCTQSLFRRSRNGLYLSPEEIWRHSLATALTSQILVERTGLEMGGAAFTAGILHNLGKVAISQYLEGADHDIDSLVKESGGDLLDLERRLASVDHATAAALVTEKWLLPNEIRRAIRNHHIASNIQGDPELTAILHVADIMVQQEGIGVLVEGMALDIDTVALKRLGIVESDLEDVRAQLWSDMQRSEDLVKLGQGPGR